MQVIYKILGLSLYFAIFNLVYSTEASAKDNKAKFLALVEKSSQGKSSCQNYNDELAKIAVTEIKPGQEYYKNRETALAVLKKLESHPGTPTESYQAFKLLPKFKEKDFTQDWMLQSIENLEYFCNIFHFYHHMKNLILNREQYKFEEAEILRLRSIIFNFIKQESQNPNLAISSMMQIGFLDLLNQLKLLGKDRDYSTQIKGLYNEGRIIKEKFLKTSSNEKKAVGKQLYMEFNESKKLAGKINSLFKTITKDLK